jgi:predicted acyl esterase
VPAISLLVRKGNPGFNNTEAERTFKTRPEAEWPLVRTEYTKFHLHSDLTLSSTPQVEPATLETVGLTGNSFQFTTAPFESDTEITGHILANLCVAVAGTEANPAPKDLDCMVTLRHIDPNGSEVFYTGTSTLRPQPLTRRIRWRQCPGLQGSSPRFSPQD